MTQHRFHLSRFYVSARQQGCNEQDALRYAIERNNNFLIKGFK